MKFLVYVFFFQCLAICALSSPSKNQASKAQKMVKRYAMLPDSITQLLVVFNETPAQNSAILVALEKKDKNWTEIYGPIPVGIGRNGFASPGAKREGDQKSPTGLFRLGQLFCYDKEVNTKMPFTQTTNEDKWIDDPNSPDYNHHIRGTTLAKSFENLKLSDNEYKYCMNIEYNMHPTVKGMGSAIFLHLSEGVSPNPSSGCVVLVEKDMEWLLNWMNPKLKPSILMGNRKILISGPGKHQHRK